VSIGLQQSSFRKQAVDDISQQTVVSGRKVKIQDLPKRCRQIRLPRTERMETSMNQSTSNTRDGFQVVRDHLTVPKDSALNQETKRALAICHLFLNRNMAIADIGWLLGEDKGTVVLALLEQGIIQDRRTQPRLAPQENERRKPMPTLRTTEVYTRLRT
jgi:hypothetical protein